MEIELINRYFDAIDIIYWINLDRSIDRRIKMEQMLKKIPIKNERIRAIDGNEYSFDAILSNYKVLPKQVIYTKIEYSVLLSHLLTIKKFSDTNYKYALILEDDATLEYIKYWDKKISEIINNAPNDWDIIMLNYMSLDPLNSLYEYNNGRLVSAQAYIINNVGANYLINKYYNNEVFDISSYHRHEADIFIFNRLKTYCYKYPYFTYNLNTKSTIHVEHIDFHDTSKKKVFKV